jgi:Calpain family cysteine protease
VRSQMVRHPGILGSGRIPGVLGRIASSVESLLDVAAKRRDIFEPQPATGWTSSLQMENYSGKPIVILPPKYSEVRQGRTGNCPVVATLAALAHAAPERIIPMLTTTSASVRARVIDTGQTTPTVRPVLIETVLYHVRFAKGDPVEVSGLLWTRGGELEYASSTRGALWPGIFEKAFVVAHGGNSYQTISASLTPHEAMTNMLGEVDELFLAEKPGKLTDLLKRAPSRPTIADTWTNLPIKLEVPAGIIGFHTYAVLNFDGSNVRVFDPRDGAVISVPLATFKRAFESVVQLRA